MRNISPVVSTLDGLLRQSLEAILREELLEDEIRIRFTEAFEHIRRFYRVNTGVVCQSVVEPGAVAIDIGRHRRLRCSRLLVQCAQSDASASRVLTLTCVPDRADRVALDIVHADLNDETSQIFQWTASGGWCSAEGFNLNGDVHSGTIEAAVHESALFNAQSMALEPLRVGEGVVR